ncbi:MAG: hypothetical protein KF847_02045 [Pirellulales bacterium]|nr:hypothetical protein [Pirellulales bacterium]
MALWRLNSGAKAHRAAVNLPIDGEKSKRLRDSPPNRGIDRLGDFTREGARMAAMAVEPVENNSA